MVTLLSMLPSIQVLHFERGHNWLHLGIAADTVQVLGKRACD